jgi:2,3-bisphosphoglycerate-independent phosphoglycerate mutase
VQGEGIKAADPVAAVEKAYDREETDEFIQPVVITGSDGQPLSTIGDQDGVIFFNFRADRVREITRALTDPEFSHFARGKYPELCGYVCMTAYDEAFDFPVAFPPVHLDGILGEVISREGLRQLRIAETEKYAHVTYFFNGGEEKPFPSEDRCLIPSPREVPTYDLKPEMSAYEVTDEVIARLDTGKYSLIVLNFANMDMVGHTGNLAAAVTACETVDKCVERIAARVRELGGIALITADHGNSEKMIAEDGGPYTAHTVNPVPLVLLDGRRKDAVLSTGCLGDIAPTILALMGIKKSEQMTGRSLIKS